MSDKKKRPYGLLFFSFFIGGVSIGALVAFSPIDDWSWWMVLLAAGWFGALYSAVLGTSILFGWRNDDPDA